tara:strand:- start:56 stop:238 length:183 start_codon:yes stop_codon:yes gene_type:complete
MVGNRIAIGAHCTIPSRTIRQLRTMIRVQRHHVAAYVARNPLEYRQRPTLQMRRRRYIHP